MTEDSDALDKFGRFLMENLRDRCIDHFAMLARGAWRSPSLQALQSEVAAFTDAQREIARRCVVAGVDSAIHDFLFKVQERADFDDDIQIIVNGQNIVPLSDGLHGEPYGSSGWRARFSRHGVGSDEPDSGGA